MKRGVKDFFAVYVGLGLTTAACLMFMYEWRNGVQITRYKSSYMVYRPNDPILKMYPKEYITDNELLPADHPTKLEDCDDLPRGRSIESIESTESTESIESEFVIRTKITEDDQVQNLSGESYSLIFLSLSPNR